MIKLLHRLIVVNLLIGHILAWVNPVSVSGKLTELSAFQILFLFWILISAITGFYFLGHIYYHWYKNQFAKKGWKIAWFIILFIGMMIKFYGPIIYYIVVVEFKKTLTRV